MSGTEKEQIEARRKYVTAFNDTMVKIWRERLLRYNILDTGALYSSVAKVRTTMDAKVLDITLEQCFNEYGLFVDRGTGRNTPKGNPGDIGTDPNRKRRAWFTRSYWRSIHNLQEFYADSVGKDFCDVVSNAFHRSLNRN